MKTSLKGILAIINEEALVLFTYRDAAGVLTIGVGHTAAPAVSSTALSDETKFEARHLTPSDSRQHAGR